MTTRKRLRAALTLTLSGAALALLAPAARADVTVGQKTSMSLGAMMIEIDSVERTSAEEQRSDSTVSCHGFLSLFCHGMDSGRIVRLDKQLEWDLQPKKKLYSERPFPTPEQRAEAQKEVEAALEKMKSCPMPQSTGAPQAAAPDPSRCQLSAPVLNVSRTDEHATIAGHDARKTDVQLSQTCTDPQTGDVCELRYGFETWLTQDAIAGLEERASFERKYLAAQGLDPSSPPQQRILGQFMAPYADMLKQLRGKAADLEGYPLRTTFYMSFGGAHCSKAKQAQQQQASSGSSFSMHGLAAHALSGGLAGLFHRGAAAIHADSAAGSAAAGAANEAAAPAADEAANAMTAQSASGGATAPATPAGPFIRVISLTTETTSIDTSSVPAAQFDIPAGWTLEPQKPGTSRAAAFECPTAAK